MRAKIRGQKAKRFSDLIFSQHVAKEFEQPPEYHVRKKGENSKAKRVFPLNVQPTRCKEFEQPRNVAAQNTMQGKKRRKLKRKESFPS